MNQELLMNPNCLVAALEKPAAEFTKADIISFIQKNNIRMVNFMYPAADGRLKTLNFVIMSTRTSFTCNFSEAFFCWRLAFIRSAAIRYSPSVRYPSTRVPIFITS